MCVLFGEEKRMRVNDRVRERMERKEREERKGVKWGVEGEEERWRKEGGKKSMKNGFASNRYSEGVLASHTCLCQGLTL